MRKIRIGSRESKLAVTQSQIVIDCIKKYHPDMEIELITMKTTGDIILDRTLDKVGGKGLFVKELDIALMEGRIDLAVHSLKDMPMLLPEELPMVAFSKREDPMDVLILPKGSKEINFELPIGCSSFRRILQLKQIYPNANFQSVRGNVITRLEKLDRGEYGALILAAAGLRRLGLEERINREFTTEEIIPAAGQAILAVQGRAGEDYSFLKEFHNKTAELQAICERAFVRELDGGCSSPVAAYAVVQEEMNQDKKTESLKNQGHEHKEQQIIVTGLYYDNDSGTYLTGTLSGPVSNAEQIGASLAKKLRMEWCNR